MFCTDLVCYNVICNILYTSSSTRVCSNGMSLYSGDDYRLAKEDILCGIIWTTPVISPSCRQYVSHRTSIPWVSLYVQGFADSPVSWGLKEHQFYTDGDNNYVLFLQPKGSYLACSYISSNKRPRRKTKKWSRKHQVKCYEINVSALIKQNNNYNRIFIQYYFFFFLHLFLSCLGSLLIADLISVLRIPSIADLELTSLITKGEKPEMDGNTEKPVIHWM